jgi:tyrosinase
MAHGITIRVSIESMEKTPDALTVLRDAYSRMQQLGAADNRSWIHWSGIHGFAEFLCWHHSKVGKGNDQRPFNLFLPWHRAYLLYFEHSARDQNKAASIPWWDWTSPVSHKSGIPKSFAIPKLSGQRNPLASGPIPVLPATPSARAEPARFSQRRPGRPARLPTAKRASALLALTSYLDFSSQLEDVHDEIHGWAGGDMGVVATSAFDPIFWSHHCMIDRLWYLWQLRHGVSNIPPDYLDRPLAPFALTVRDVLDINRIGYEYASTTLHAGAAGPS